MGDAVDGVNGKSVIQKNQSKTQWSPHPRRTAPSVINAVIAMLFIPAAAAPVLIPLLGMSYTLTHLVAQASALWIALAIERTVYSRGRVASTTRRALVRLPVIGGPTAQRFAALAGAAEKTCERCEHFDHRAGQELMRAKVDFMRAASVLSPSQMMKTKDRPWDASSGFDERGQPLDTGREDRWDELGVCRRKKLGVFARHTCEDWS